MTKKTNDGPKLKLKVLKPGTTRLKRAIQRVFREGPRNSISGRTLVGKNIAFWPRSNGAVYNNNKFNLNTFVHLKSHPFTRKAFNFGNVIYLDKKRQELPLSSRIFYDILAYYHTLPNSGKNSFINLIENNTPEQRRGFLNWIASKYNKKPNIRSRITPNITSRAVNSLRRHMTTNNNSSNSGNNWEEVRRGNSSNSNS